MEHSVKDTFAMTQAPHAVVVLSDGYLHRPESPLHGSDTRISRWRLVQVKHAGALFQRHLVGLADDEGRVTTAITALNLQTMQAETASGRIYTVFGPPGTDRDAAYVYAKWLEYGEREEMKDLTRALQRLRQMRSSLSPA